MKPLLWFYSICATMYLVMYLTGFEPVVKYAVGALWLVMMGGPVVFALLILVPIYFGRGR